MTERYFEDYVVGSSSEHGSVPVEETEVVDFGRRFDPQPFHVDRNAAADGPFGGLIASGWHTCALMMRLLAEQYLSPVSSLGSPASTSYDGCYRYGPVTTSRSGPPSRTRACPGASLIAVWCGPASSS